MGKPKQQILVEKEFGARPATNEPQLPTKKRGRGRPRKIQPMGGKKPVVDDCHNDPQVEDLVEELVQQHQVSRGPEPIDSIIAFFEFEASNNGLTEQQYEFLAQGISRGATLAQAAWYAQEKWKIIGLAQKILQKNEKIKKALAEKNMVTMVRARDSVATQIPFVVDTVVDIVNRSKQELDWLSGEIRKLPPQNPLYGQLTRNMKESNVVMQTYLKIYSDLLEWSEKGIKIASEDADQDMLKRKLEGLMEEHVLEEDEGNAESPVDTDTCGDEPRMSPLMTQNN